jgi:hypothetical protein
LGQPFISRDAPRKSGAVYASKGCPARKKDASPAAFGFMNNFATVVSGAGV